MRRIVTRTVRVPFVSALVPQAIPVRICDVNKQRVALGVYTPGISIFLTKTTNPVNFDAVFVFEPRSEGIRILTTTGPLMFTDKSGCPQDEIYCVAIDDGNASPVPVSIIEVIDEDDGTHGR